MYGSPQTGMDYCRKPCKINGKYGILSCPGKKGNAGELSVKDRYEFQFLRVIHRAEIQDMERRG
jgi:hypothetical protein